MKKVFSFLIPLPPLKFYACSPKLFAHKKTLYMIFETKDDVIMGIRRGGEGG